MKHDAISDRLFMSYVAWQDLMRFSKIHVKRIYDLCEMEWLQKKHRKILWGKLQKKPCEIQSCINRRDPMSYYLDRYTGKPCSIRSVSKICAVRRWQMFNYRDFDYDLDMLSHCGMFGTDL